MPDNFCEISSYCSLMAIRYAVLAKAARDQGDSGAASYHADQAARYVQASQEQRITMRQTPGRPIEYEMPRRLFKEPQCVSFAPARLLAALRGA